MGLTYKQLPFGQAPAAAQGPRYSTKVTPKEWAALRKAVASAPKLETLIMRGDGKLGFPSGWQKLEEGGFVSEADEGLKLQSLVEVLDHEAGKLGEKPFKWASTPL